jgi:hypothetical protein
VKNSKRYPNPFLSFSRITGIGINREHPWRSIQGFLQSFAEIGNKGQNGCEGYNNKTLYFVKLSGDMNRGQPYKDLEYSFRGASSAFELAFFNVGNIPGGG